MVLRMRLDINGKMIGTAVIVNVTDANLIAYALHHILCRWVDGDKVELDRVQRRFYLVKEKP